MIQHNKHIRYWKNCLLVCKNVFKKHRMTKDLDHDSKAGYMYLENTIQISLHACSKVVCECRTWSAVVYLV